MCAIWVEKGGKKKTAHLQIPNQYLCSLQVTKKGHMMKGKPEALIDPLMKLSSYTTDSTQRRHMRLIIKCDGESPHWDDTCGLVRTVSQRQSGHSRSHPT